MKQVIVAGSPNDTYHQPSTVCKFNGATPTNAPCVTQYTDPSMMPSTVFYGYNGLPFSYSIPLADGLYDLSLTFIEPNKTAVNQRVFMLSIPGKPDLRVDIFAAVGLKQPYMLAFTEVQVTGGKLNIGFQPVFGNAVISVIQIRTSRSTGALFGGHA